MLQDLLAGVRDRVVIAITFLAMLELMKRREIVVDQTEPWGPIVARRDDGPGTGALPAWRVLETRRSTRPWSRSHDRRSARGAGRDGRASDRRR